MVLPAKDYDRILEKTQQAFECSAETTELLRSHSNQLRQRAEGAVESTRQVLFRCRELARLQDRLLTQADEITFVNKILGCI